jgi:hypothetical protein
VNASFLHVTHVEFKRAPTRLRRRGLIGFASVELNGTLRLNGIVVREGYGEFSVERPVSRDRRGQRHEVVEVAPEAWSTIASGIIHWLKAAQVLR